MTTSPNRVERAKVELKIAGKELQRPDVQEKLADLDFGAKRKFGRRDTYAISYDFRIAYYGEVAKNLRAIAGLLSIEEVWADVSLWEASGGSLIIADFIDAVRQVERAIEARAP